MSAAFSESDLAAVWPVFQDEVRAQTVALLRQLPDLLRAEDRTEAAATSRQAAERIRGAALLVRLPTVTEHAQFLVDQLAAIQTGSGDLPVARISQLERVTESLADFAEVTAELIPTTLATAEPAWRELRGDVSRQSAQAVSNSEDLPTPAAAMAGSEQPQSSAARMPQTSAPPPSTMTPTGAQQASIKPLPAASSSLLELFRDEASTQTALLSRLLVELEHEPNRPDWLEELMRSAHSLKGAARIVSLDAVVQLAHAMEDVFVQAQKARLKLTSEMIDGLLASVDFVQELSSHAGPGYPEFVVSQSARQMQLQTGLAALLAGQSWPAGTANELRSATASAAIAPTVLAGVAVHDAKPLASEVPNQPPPDRPQSSLTSAERSPKATAARGGHSADRQSSQATAAAKAEPDRVVRISAQSLSTLLSLAGESLVASRWLQPFARALQHYKRGHDRLALSLDQLQAESTGKDSTESFREILAELREDATRSRRELSEHLAQFESHARQSDDLNSRLYREVLASRMRPFSDGIHGFSRVLRDLARQLGKKVRLDVKGSNTDVDRDIIEKLEAPLNHLLRNAIDHGIEPPAERSAAGKPETATITLEARHQAGMLAITVSDDGRGISLERVRRKILERGLTTPELLGRMSESEIFDFLFLPGFSTAAAVTEVSGRGVGLDVVQTMAHEVGGSIRITSSPGVGTQFHLQLPITLSVLRAVLVQIGDIPYALALNRTDRLLRASASDLRSVEGKHYLDVDGKSIGLVMGYQVLGMAETGSSDPLCVALISDRDQQYGLVVDQFLGEQDLVVRPLDRRLGKVPNVSAASVLEDGSPVLIIDVEDLLRSIMGLITGSRLLRADRVREAAAVSATRRILVVDDSPTVREVERQLLLAQGYEVDTAIDGADGLNAARTGEYDLIVSDIDMPRMNGLQMIATLRGDPSLRQVPVIVISYKGSDQDRARGLEAGANYYLTKASFHDNRFLEAVQELIGGPTG